MMEKTVKAKKVREGDYLQGLDDGYVVEVLMDDYNVEILFHDAEGNEATLTCAYDMPVTVKR